MYDKICNVLTGSQYYAKPRLDVHSDKWRRKVLCARNHCAMSACTNGYVHVYAYAYVNAYIERGILGTNHLG